MGIENALREGASQYDVFLNERQIEQFMQYKNLLLEWNNKINLTAITDDDGIIHKHFLDSISIIKSGIIKERMSLIDVGTGAGFPGLPLKIIMPELKVVLLDSLNKRINYLNTVISELGLQGIECIHGRAEEIAKDKKYREKFDIATARAVANMMVLSEYCIPYVKIGGYFIAMKGPSANDELEDARNAIGTLGGKYLKIVDTNIQGNELQHKLIIVEKQNSTEGKYPRKAGQIDKNPIK